MKAIGILLILAGIAGFVLSGVALGTLACHSHSVAS